MFPEGWRRAAIAAVDAGLVQGSLLEALADEDRAAMDRLAADRRGLAIHLREREAAEGLATEVAPPRTVSVGGVIDYTLSQALLLEPRASLPGSPTCRPDRDRDPSVDRTPLLGPGTAARAEDAPDLGRGTRG